MVRSAEVGLLIVAIIMSFTNLSNGAGKAIRRDWDVTIARIVL